MECDRLCGDRGHCKGLALSRELLSHELKIGLGMRVGRLELEHLQKRLVGHAQ
eukprot:CAMPEP_0114542132 /NCGR_PEP_ID=MMETSP0114-20121206/1676_1 /TAXON_ID=31324 /ORGANISM="Goniomonas sp, Strain m" /LENGTH=52 /DNA_ID=CAMNT_0001726417 /DNA_START=471 /DNA_END=629 /DNA_ORIENTATION=+